MNEEFELLKDVAVRLESAGIKYMMTGSMAMAFYSTPRMTRDIDIIIQVSSADVDRIVNLFREDFYIEEESVRFAVVNRGMFNVIHNDSIIKVDFIVRKDEDYRIEEFSRRKRISFEGVAVSVVTPEDLILSKLVWAKRSQSELQLRDARRMVNSIKQPENEYLERWSKILGVSDLLLKVMDNE